jgi:ABC-type multidrug transport system fused ATPase/permease subunit
MRAPARIRAALARLAPLTAESRLTILVIVLASTAAGLAEAAVLAIVAGIATAMAANLELVAFHFGPFSVETETARLLALAGGLAVLRLALHLVSVRLPARVAGAVQRRIRAQMFDAFLASEWQRKARDPEGHLQELMGAQTAYAGHAVLQLGNGLAALLGFSTLTLSAFVVSPGVAALVMVIAVSLFIGLRPLSRTVRIHSSEASAALLKQATGVSESVRLAQEVEVLGVRDAERTRVVALVDSLERSYVRTRELGATVPAVYQGAVILLIVAGLAALHVVGPIQMSSLGAVVLLMVRAASYGQQIQTAYQGIGEATPYLDRLADATKDYVDNKRRDGTLPLETVRTIEFRSVSFDYAANRPVLEDVSFSFEAGTAIGITGPSGAGKSTLIQILLRLREPTSGSYLVNDVPAGELLDVAWTERFAYLPQEPHTLSGTAFENIRFFRTRIDGSAVVRAAELAHIHDDLLALPDGYASEIGERQNSLSGGQRQRLCLARALAGSPEVLVLDEPTSNLDHRSESLIRESIGALRGSLTLIVVTHGTALLDLCDHVMVIRGGRVESSG